MKFRGTVIMKKLWSFFSVLGLLLIINSPAIGYPVLVNMYQNGGEIEESLYLIKTVKDVDIFIPGYVDLNSFVVLSSPRIINIETKKLSIKKCPLVKELVEKFNILSNRMELLKEDEKINLVRIKFCENLINNKIQSTQELKKIDRYLYNNLKRLYKNNNELRKKIDLLKAKLDNVKEEMSSLSGGYDYFYKIHLTFEHKVSPPAKVIYKYFTPKIKWNSVFDMYFYPRKRTSNFVWRGRVFQGTGADWKDVDLILSTMPRSYRLEPPPLNEWVIGEQKRVFYKGFNKAMPLKSRLYKESLLKNRSIKRGIPNINKSFIAEEVNLGKTSLKSGIWNSVVIRRFSFVSTYDYLIRPLDAQKAFLRAKIDLRPKQKTELYAEGKVNLFLENNFIGTGHIDFKRTPVVVYLGPDSEVEIKNIEKKNISGTKGFFNNKKTREFLWDLKIKNLKPIPITVTVEIPWPKIRDKRIILTNLSKGFVLKDQRLAREFHLNAGEEQDITYGFKISYPKDMNVYIKPYINYF